MKTNRIILAGAVASTAVLLGASALADTIYNIETTVPSGTGVLIGDSSSPVVTAILSSPGVYGTKTYTGWSFLVNDGSGPDGTGSMDIFTTAANLNTIAPGYTPHVGDVLMLGGTYSPFHQIPELATPNNLLLNGTAPAPGPVVRTIPQLNVPILPFSGPAIAGQYIELDNVTITGAGAGGLFPTTANATTATETFTITDAGNNSMIMFDWVTSYTTCAAFGGMPIPSGPVNLLGFDSVFTSGTTTTIEFTPVAIEAVPEPAMIALAGLAVAGLWISRRRIS